MPTELSPAEIAAIRARHDNPRWFRHPQSVADTDALLSHADALQAKVARLEGELREAATEPRIPFGIRGIGSDRGQCFMCGNGEDNLLSNIAAFVGSKEAGDEIVAMLDGRAKNDYRPSEPNWIQVKVCACGAHVPNLEHLCRLCGDRNISKSRIKQAKGAAHVAHD